MQRINIVIGIVVRRGEVLVCQRKADVHLGGLWEFPGGKRLPDETDEACLQRELMEEVGITIKPLRALPPINHDYETVKVQLRPYLCEHVAGEPSAIACQQVRWIAPKTLHELPFPPANTNLITTLTTDPSFSMV